MFMILVSLQLQKLLVHCGLDGVGEAWVRPDGLPLRSAVVRDGHAVWAARVLLAGGRAVRAAARVVVVAGSVPHGCRNPDTVPSSSPRGGARGGGGGAHRGSPQPVHKFLDGARERDPRTDSFYSAEVLKWRC